MSWAILAGSGMERPANRDRSGSGEVGGAVGAGLATSGDVDGPPVVTEVGAEDVRGAPVGAPAAGAAGRGGAGARAAGSAPRRPLRAPGARPRRPPPRLPTPPSEAPPRRGPLRRSGS